MKLPVGITCNIGQNPATLSRLRAFGYEYIDYQDFIGTVCNPLYTMEEPELLREMARQRQLIEQAGLHVYQVHGPWQYPPTNTTAEQQADWADKVARSIRGAHALGCRYLVMHPIMPYFGTQEPEPGAHLRQNIAFFSRLIPVAAQNDVEICIENMPFADQSTSAPVGTLELIKALQSPYCRMCLDTGHCAVLGISPADAVREIGREYLRVLHVHDNDGHGDCHWIPYTGVINWSDFSRALEEIGFSGVLSLETGIRASQHTPPHIREQMEHTLAEIARTIAEHPAGNP